MSSGIPSQLRLLRLAVEAIEGAQVDLQRTLDDEVLPKLAEVERRANLALRRTRRRTRRASK
jgi:hypothetical protein